MEQNKESSNNEKSLSGAQFRKELMEILLMVVLAVGISLLIITFVGQRTVVRGSSMEPTLHDGDQLIVYKLLYFFSEPKKGDIVVVDIPYEKRVVKNEKLYIKRVIATEGETVKVKDKKVFINGIPQDEPNVISDGYDYTEFEESEVPKDCSFVLGDNRVNSRDSRELGFIPNNEIKGKAVFRIWPLNKIGSTK